MLREELLHRIGQRDEFQWRGHSHVSRLESFSDTVFAVALTITIVSSAEPKTFDELAIVVSGFVGFAIVFAFLVQLWYFHFLFFRRYNLQDQATLVLNAILLFVILFYTYPLKFLFTALVQLYTAWIPNLPHVQATISDAQWPALMTMYGVGFFLVYALYGALYMHAYRLRDELKLEPREVWLTQYSIIVFLLVGCVGIASIVVTFWSRSPWLGGLTYLLTTLPSEIGRRIKDRRMRAFGLTSR
ncbi:MAG: DUF1211 domain-containing protein [Candidatus Eremiobacteraeota bacterium]|nr:DUF1211 domain-containing protein [Candidatus Eremiobacteraeota bacterium]MBV8460753.1 DUF1211 domain-containing protein [Candidatus Eremiobacteraeota bacterium]MBV8668977.1 DUF1211 domain-containing protein [Candidatus Eremiobacteraeota bacterium]